MITDERAAELRGLTSTWSKVTPAEHFKYYDLAANLADHVTSLLDEREALRRRVAELEEQVSDNQRERMEYAK